MKARSFKRILSLILTLCLLCSVFSSSIIFSKAASSAIKIENVEDYVCADFNNNRLFTLKDNKLYFNDLNYGGGYVIYDFEQIYNAENGLTFLDAHVSGNMIYTLFTDNKVCYFNSINISTFQAYTNTLNFDCKKFIVLDNGDLLVSLYNGGDFLFYLKPTGEHHFYPLTDHIYDFYGYIGNNVFYKNGAGLSYGTITANGFVQSKSNVSGFTVPDYNHAKPFEFFPGNICASNRGSIYTIQNAALTDILDIDRAQYSDYSGTLTAVLPSADLLISANGVNTLTAFHSSTFVPVSSVTTQYMPYLLYSNDSGLLCIEKDGDDFYFERFDLSDFIAIEPTVYDLNEEAVYKGRTKDDIAKLYSDAIGGKDLSRQVLSDQGSLTSPYAGTLIDGDIQNELLDFSNYLRSLCGLSEYSYGGDELASSTGKGAVLLNRVWRGTGYTGHTPAKPEDMDEEFYNEAYDVCGGNISYGCGGTVYEQIRAIRGLNDDIHNASNVEYNSGGYHQGYNTPGHRNCFLQRGGNKLTYGYADSVLLQYYEYAQSNPNASGTINETGNNEAAYAWPSPGFFPADEIDTTAVWTLYFNTDKLNIGKREPVVTIMDMATGERFIRDTEMHDADGQRTGYSTCNFWGKCLSFSPPSTDSFAGKSYKVIVENLVDGSNMPATVEYTVSFFDYEGEYTIDGSVYSMDSYGNLTLISQPTEEITTEVPTTEPITTEQPATVQPTTEVVTTEPPATEPLTTEPPSTSEPTMDIYENAVIGDVNNDGFVDVLDATVVQKFASEIAPLNDLQKYVADVNDDGIVDVLDAAEIQKYSAEKTGEFKKKH